MLQLLHSGYYFDSERIAINRGLVLCTIHGGDTPAELTEISRSGGYLAVDGLILSRSSRMMSRVMNKQLPLASQIEEWTREAVVRWGDDWKQIAAHIHSRFAELGDAERARMTAEASLTLLGPSGCETDDSLH